MATKPRPLGYKAAEAARMAGQFMANAMALLEEAERDQDRRPDEAAQKSRDARLWIAQAQVINLRLQLGQFED